MKKELRGFIIGVIITMMILGSVVFSESITQTIEVIFNSVNLEVNGKKVEADNILYNGTTYVPLRAVAEILGKEVGWNQETRTASINDKVAEKDAGIPIKVEDISYDIKILEPNIIGTRYMEATYTNNSKYPITSVRMTVLLKDKNEKTYLTNHDTVLPGETSPIFDTFAPPSGRYEDIEILEIAIRAVGENGKTMVIEYDTKLKKYDYMEY